MKIYNEVRIDIDTMNIVYEDSFEYDGPVAMCGGSGGGDSEVKYQQSPQQAAIYKAAKPVVQRIWRQGGDAFANQFNFGDYMLPTQDWYNNVSGEMRQAMWEPYNEGANQLMEQMGHSGTLGSPRSGYTGAAGAALGEYYSNAADSVAMNTWNMGSGYRNAYYNAQMFPYTSALGALGGTYGNAVVDPGSMGSNPAAGILSGAIGGGTMGYSIGSGLAAGGSYGSSAGPWGAAIGAVAGGLLGWLGS